MIRIAIAGGIGSGKSLVTSILRDIGAKVVVADEINAQLLIDPDYIKLIENTFPSVVHNNSIDRKALANIVYHDEEKRAILMGLAHPKIFEKMLSMYPDENILFYEIPLLSHSRIVFDRIWFINSRLEIRIARIMSRDNVDESFAARVISLQREEDDFALTADTVIDNNGDRSSLFECVKREYYSILRQFS